MWDNFKAMWSAIFAVFAKQAQQIEHIVDANDNLVLTYGDKTAAYRKNEAKRDEIAQAAIDKELADLLKAHKSGKSK